MYLPPIGTRLEALDTPALVVDAPVLERNIARMAAWSRRTGCAVRPHAKAHKTPLIARKQLAAGAIGICCAKLGEAEAMVAGGVPSVLITSEVVGAAKLRRLVAIARHAGVLVVVDDAANAGELSRAAAAAGVEVERIARDPSRRVREAVLNPLGWQRHGPWAERLVAHMAGDDPSQQLREHARGILA